MQWAIGDVVLRVDHVAFGSPDIDDAINRLASLGLSHTAVSVSKWTQSDHDHEARSVSVVLDDGYLDIIELPASSIGAGEPIFPTGVILGSTDLHATRRRLMTAGVRCGRPYGIDRHFDPDHSPQHYTVFGVDVRHSSGLPLGVDVRHSSGLPLGVIETTSTAPMAITVDHGDGPSTLAAAARQLGVDLE
ncbi:MAG: hypothetical protein ACR2QE_20130 [Acidimicrobiales bacterium]